MHENTEFLRNLAIVLCTAAATSVLFQRLRQPVVFGYLFAGMIIGPHVPIPIMVDEGTVHTLSELGVILLMFGLGLEFSLRKLMQVWTSAGVIALLQCSLMILFGYLVGQAFGWTGLESFYAGAIIAISSTTIIIKAFAEQRATGKYTGLVFGVLIIEDLIGIFLIAILTAVSAGAAVSASGLGTTAAQLVMFLAGLIGIGLLTIPRLTRYLVRLNRPETTLVASVGICFAASLLALQFEYSVALGAFIAGSLIAESGEEKTVEHLVGPVRDMFAAIFFVSVGMLIDPKLIAEHWVAVLVFTVIVIVGKVVAVTLGAFVSGFGARTSVQTGMSLAQIGEFSFIIAGVGLALNAIGDFLYTIAVAVSAITTLTTPWLIRASGPVATWVDRRLPKPMQTFVSLYGSWVERLRSAPPDTGGRSKVRRLVQLILLDVAFLAALVIGGSLEYERISGFLESAFGFGDRASRFTIIAAVAVVAIPLLFGLVRSARGLAVQLAARALPVAEAGKIDIAQAPRRVLVATLQLAIVFLVGVPLITVTQPFLPPLQGPAVLVVVVLVLGIAFWRSATNLHGHARAGAEVIVATLAQQMSREKEGGVADGEGSQSLEHVHTMLPGLGDPVRVTIAADSPAVEHTLAQLNLRGNTGATVLAITRGDERVVLPIGREVLHAGDVLALAGTHEAVEAAIDLLRPAAPAPSTPDPQAA